VLSEPIAVTLLVVDALQSLGVSYLISGSLASGVHGRMRATMDADLVADLRLEHGEALAQALGDAFYVDVEMIRQAIRQHGSFNLIHLETTFKVDIFISKGRPFDHRQLERRVAQVVSTEPERTAYFASAEDIVLSKLEWYRMGGEVSDRQWKDVMGVLKVQSTRLDRIYLRRWAQELDVADLLDRALLEAELDQA
jgi:hypothetical protein